MRKRKRKGWLIFGVFLILILFSCDDERLSQKEIILDSAEQDVVDTVNRKEETAADDTERQRIEDAVVKDENAEYIDEYISEGHDFSSYENGKDVQVGPICGDNICEPEETDCDCPSDCWDSSKWTCDSNWWADGACDCDCGEKDYCDCEADECCVPDCSGKACGDDGCEGSCGSCENDYQCVDGNCELKCIDECDYIGEKECLDNYKISTCGDYNEDGCLEMVFNIVCGPNYKCKDGECVSICVDECVIFGEKKCFGNYLKECGDSDTDSCLEWNSGDLCDGNYICEVNKCVCQPNCVNKKCGDDDCGGNCGVCQAGYKCEEGECVELGDYCDSCNFGEDCKPGWGCYNWSSTPDVSWCAPVALCSNDAECGDVKYVCNPNWGNTCKPFIIWDCNGNDVWSKDSCGNWVKLVESCGVGKTCSNGKCVSAQFCGNGNCDSGETCTSCSQDCGSCASCGDGKCNGSETQSNCCKDCDCASGKTCQNNQCVCVPNCTNKECGDDGCGGSCGVCNNPPPDYCSDSGTLIDYNGTSACPDGKCGYSYTEKMCQYGCSGGGCNDYCTSDDGCCSPTWMLSCGQPDDWATNYPLNTDVVDDYPCSPFSPNYTGPEFTYQFTTTIAGTYSVVLTNESSSDTDVMVIKDFGDQCLPGECITYGFKEATFEAKAGELFYIVVDGWMSGEGTYTITVKCPGDCDGDCSGKECGDDGCGGSCGTGICNNPPADYCLDSSMLWKSSGGGYCSKGKCEYPGNGTNCQCSNGKCIECQKNSDCNDNNPCTEDSCDSNNQCHTYEISGCCQNDSECGANEICEDNQCVKNTCTPKTCTADYPNKCGTFDDGCNSAISCACFGGGYSCQGGKCVFIGECLEDSDCNDNNPCTEDSCDSNNQCHTYEISGCCVSSCSGKACGDDGCGGSCGSCSSSYKCENYKCVYDAKCGNGVCDSGENPCNCKTDCSGCCTTSDCSSCGTCKEKTCTNYVCGCKTTTPCCGNGSCESSESYCNCQSDCSKKCGDGCCSTGEDKCNCETDCGNHCGDGTCNCGETCSTCSQDCYSPTSCDEISKECGTWSDGCGNTIICGGCPSGKTCNADGTCICTPNCSGKNCGDDGCGGSCGSCSGSCQKCVNGACQNETNGIVCQASACSGLVWYKSKACSSGSCSGGGGTQNCNDSNVCTNDSCSSSNGCSSVNNTISCDDGNSCTGSDKCSNGTCKGSLICDTYENNCNENNSSSSTSWLGNTTDDDGDSAFSVNATIYPAGDADFYEWWADDTLLNYMDPYVELTNLAGNYKLCAYWMCDKGESAIYEYLTCPIESLLVIGNIAYPGCCSDNSGTTSEKVHFEADCDDVGDDNGTVIVKVSANSGESCSQSYKLTGHF